MAGAVHELANELLCYGVRLQIVPRNGTPVEVHCYATDAAPRGRCEELLTGGEARIARMAAAGSTNHEIAACLSISHKTVEAHLGHVYRKLAIRSRTELAYVLAS
jgi:DNA-binding NarL/FixJ family response regulator